MERRTLTPRPDWAAKVESLGLVWHSADGQPYWDESACYRLTPAQVAELESASAELYRLFVAAGDHILSHDLLDRFAIPAFCHDAIRKDWEAEPLALNFGRFDLGYDGHGPPKLFEFNCDTPTSLLEAAVVQWNWRDEVFPGAAQYNRLHDALVAKWHDIAPPRRDAVLHLAHATDPSGEDQVTVAYLADTAHEAGIDTFILDINMIGWDAGRRRFVDPRGANIDCLFKLYPWEWLVREPFAPQLIESLPAMFWIEPIWKMIWSNKAILPILWDLFPGHPNLLEARFEPLPGDHVAKPILAREGANIRIVRSGQTVAESGGDYGGEAMIYQALYPLPGEGNRRPVVGSWIVDGEPVGIGIREDGAITGNAARFIPHIVAD